MTSASLLNNAKRGIHFPPILVLDEATSMFDPEGEKSFIEECEQLLSRRTVILITHRPASLALADRVLELKEGKIVIACDCQEEYPQHA